MSPARSWGVAVVVLTLGVGGAEAAQRTFVSAAAGSDANPCTRALPCRNLQVADAATDPGGEIVVLDSGGFGPVSLTKSVSLVAPAGVHAAITVFSGDGIQIAAGSADAVVVSGFYINGLGGENGIDFESGKSAHIDRCVISGFDTGVGLSGIGVFLRAGLGEGTEAHVVDTVSRENRIGFYVGPSSGNARANLWRVRAAENTEWGIAAAPGAKVVVRDSVSARSGENGFYANGSGAELTLEGCTAAFNGTGVRAQGLVRVRNTTIFGNTTGVSYSMPGDLVSFGRNRLIENGTDGSFTSTSPPQ